MTLELNNPSDYRLMLEIAVNRLWVERKLLNLKGFTDDEITQAVVMGNILSELIEEGKVNICE